MGRFTPSGSGRAPPDPPYCAGERGIACRMQIEGRSLPHLRRFPDEKATAIETALQPLLVNPPKPVFTLRWDEESRNWRSEFAAVDGCPQRCARSLCGNTSTNWSPMPLSTCIGFPRSIGTSITRRRRSYGGLCDEELEAGAARHALCSGGTRGSMSAISRGRSLCTVSHTTFTSTRKYS